MSGEDGYYFCILRNDHRVLFRGVMLPSESKPEILEIHRDSIEAIPREGECYSQLGSHVRWHRETRLGTTVTTWSILNGKGLKVHSYVLQLAAVSILDFS